MIRDNRIWDEMQSKIVRIAESKKKDFIDILQDAYGDSPDTIFTACRFAYYIHSGGNMSVKAFNKIWGQCKAYFISRGDDANLLKLEDLMVRLNPPIEPPIEPPLDSTAVSR